MARLSREDKQAIELAIVVDSVGLAQTPNCVFDDVSSPEHVERARAAARSIRVDLGTARVPTGATSDFEPFKHTSFGADFLRGLTFNLVGGLLPQRSWFTGQHDAPVLYFAGCQLLGFGDFVASQLMLPLGSLHGAFDQPSRVDAGRLHEQFAIIDAMLETQQGERRTP